MAYRNKKRKIIFHPFKNTRIIGFITVLLLVLVLPLALFTLKQNTENRSRATASTTLAFSSTQWQGNIGDLITNDVTLNPGNNAVSFINLVISYDSSKIHPGPNAFVVNKSVFPDASDILDGPTFDVCNGTQCTMSLALSIGSNPTSAIRTSVKIATITMQAVAATDQGGTQLGFDAQTQILSIGPSDKPNENVLSSSTPLTITIGNSGSFTPTPGGGATPTPGGATPTPGGTSPTPGPTGTATSYKLSMIFPGIGATAGNQHPLHPARKAHITYYNLDTGKINTYDTTLVFDGKYFTKPQFDPGQLPDGNYEIFIRTPFSLTTRLSQADGTSTFIINSTATQPFTVPVNTFLAGDVAPDTSLSKYGDDILDLLDYNAIINCYGQKSSSATCTNKQAADLDDNGVIDGIDYNILLRGLSITRAGDPIPVAPQSSASATLRLH